MIDPQGKSFVLVKHTYYDSSGTPEGELLRFLSGKATAILDILHPFPDAVSIPLNSTSRLYDDTGKLTDSHTSSIIPGHPILFYIRDVFLTLWFVLRSGRQYDLFIGSDNLNTFAGLILRFLGRVRHVVFYVIDFTPHRFPNKTMNAIYQWINKLCCYHADTIWNVSASMTGGRESIGITKERSAPQITVPLGCAFDTIPRRAVAEIHMHDIVYFGSLREEHGPGLILEALPHILERHPEATVTFAGGGELKPVLEARADALGVSSNVRFTGFLDSGEDIYAVLTRCGLALATYKPGDTTYKLYSDPGKVKIYLACGLPILITDVPPVAREIAEKGAGVIVPWDAGVLAAEIVKILDDRERYGIMRENAIRLGAEYDWQTIWKRTFAAMDETQI